MLKQISNFQQVASVRRYTVTDGRGRGMDVIDCDNGKIRFLINVNKACDIMQLYHEGQNVSFLSKNAFIAQKHNFLNVFEGGMLYTCGLDSIGDREGFEMHGSLHGTIAEIIKAECSEDGIFVKAIIRSTALFGKNLILKREIFCEINGDSVTVNDTLLNAGYKEEEYCILYHVNIGYPMLDDGGQIIADIVGFSPRNAYADSQKKEIFKITNPVDCNEETCYYLKLKSPKISYINKKLGKQVSVEYSGDTLQNFIEWKSIASGDYALGFEPTTTLLDDKFKYSLLKPNASVKFFVKIECKKI